MTITVNRGPKTATMPDGLVGEKRGDVKNALEKAGFTDVTESPAESEPIDSDKDEVLSITPAEGTTVALDDQITITYATGKSPVPNLVNRTEGQAEEDAEAAGFDTKSVTKESDQPAGIVIAQNPTDGTKLERGSSITITVAKPKPTPPPPSTPPPVTPPPITPPPNTPSPSPSGTPGG